MKVRFYCDMYIGQGEHIHANSVCYTRCAKGSTRYAFDVEFPDPAEPEVILDCGGAQQVSEDAGLEKRET